MTARGYCRSCESYGPVIGELCSTCRELPGQSSIFDEWEPRAHARRGAELELEAAESIERTVGGQLVELLAVYRNGSRWTDREAGSQTSLPPDGWSKRAADLRQLGLIERFLEDDEPAWRRDDATGRRALLSRITDRGTELLES